MRLLFLLLLCLGAYPALAQGDDPEFLGDEPPPAEDAATSEQGRVDSVIVEEAAEQAGISLYGERPQGQGTIIQPLDDSDPEMKALIQQYYQLVPCRDEHDLIHCENALTILRGGGDRLARYLIPHIEANDRAGFPDETYTQLLGRTESANAYEYLRKRMLHGASQVEQRAGGEAAHNRMLVALQSVGYTRALPAIDDAIAMMERFPKDVEITNYAVNVLDRVVSKHGPQPRAEQALRAVQARFADAPSDLAGDGDSPGGIRDRVERMLVAPGRTR